MVSARSHFIQQLHVSCHCLRLRTTGTARPLRVHGTLLLTLLLPLLVRQ